VTAATVTTTAKLLLQLDLEGHSDWLRHADSKPAAVTARVSFAEAVSKRLVGCDFSRVFWAGDGGLFARDATGLPSYDCVVSAAVEAARVFAEWRDESPDRTLLGLRLSAHAAHPLYEHPDPSYWTSDDLNVFAKYERDIGIAGTIAITDVVREHLSPPYAAQFPQSAARDLFAASPSGDKAVIRRIFYTVHPETRAGRPAYKTLARFCGDFETSETAAEVAPVGPRNAIRATLSGAALLYATDTPGGRMIVDLQRSSSPGRIALTDDEAAVVNARAARIEDELAGRGLANQGMLSPDRVTLPLLDIPCLVVRWHEERWSRARAFHYLLHSSGEARSRYSRVAADVTSERPRWPAILGCHIVVTVRSRVDGTLYVVLSQRNPNGPPDAYYKGLWSASIEEQVKIGESPEQCIRRALGEELLGFEASHRVEGRPLGLFLETSLLNLCLLSLVSLPMGYEELALRWLRDAPDHDESRQLVALPLRRDIIAEVLAAGALSAGPRAECLISDSATFDETSEWSLHPTSSLRLAAALWAAEAPTPRC
jgi:hypothetical protein